MATDLTEHILVHYRWVFVILFLLPLSFVYEFWIRARNAIVFRINSAPYKHDDKVKRVQKQVQNWNKSAKTKKMCTARPGWQTMSFRFPLYKQTSYQIRIDLVDVLDVDAKNMTVRVEPLVNMGQLSATLLPLGFTLPVVPEIDDLTVGGMVMGTGIESSSHIYGLFQHMCLSYELVLADGSVIVCDKKNDPDLFYSIPWSHGTLGFLTAVTLSIIPAKKYVKLQYHHTRSLDETVDVFSTVATKMNPSLFVEGIAFSINSAVIMTGDLVDEVPRNGIINEIGVWHKPWFFKHVKDTRHGQIEFIPLRQYYHRHTKSIFWELQDIVPFGNNILFRYLLGWLMPPKISLLKMTQTKAVKNLYEKCHMIQDMLVPLKHFKPAMQKFHNEVEIYPMWLCPFKLPRLPGLLKVEDQKADSQMYIDIGVYGVPKSSSYETVKSTRSIEKFVAECKGFQMLYADTYTSREEFRNMFDHSLYDKMRKSLKCEDAFPELYDKVSKSARF